MGTVANLSVKIGANTQDFNAGLNKLAGEVQGVSSRLAAAGAVIAGAFSLNAIGGAMTDVIEKTSRIADGAARIGVSAEAFQRLSFAAQQSGGSMSAIESSMRIMADRLTDGKLPQALLDMGLSIEQLRAMAPDQAFLTIANAVAGIPDPMLQSSVAVDIFGRGAQAILPAIKAGFSDIANTAPVMSNAMIASADQMGDKWAEMQMKMDNLRAQALLPLLNGFMQLPASMQMVGAGMVSMLPVIEPLALALIALGGPGKAIAMVTAGFSTIATFFTATLIPAFVALLPYIAVGGAIALGIYGIYQAWKHWDEIVAFFKGAWTFVTNAISKFPSQLLPMLGPIGMVVAAFRHWDDIKRIAEAVFTAVKTWLVDKFNAIVNSIKEKVGMVTGFFKDMYMKVVGGSFVPDMVRGIGQWFGQLQGNMVNPAQSATNSVSGFFKSMMDSVNGSIDGFISRIPVVGGLLSDLFSSMGGIGGLFGGGGIGGMFGGLLSGLGGGLTGGLGGLLSGAIGAIGNHLKGGEEGMYVNPARDAYMSQFQIGRPGLTGWEATSVALEQAGYGGTIAQQLMQQLSSADTMTAFNAATANIDRYLSGADMTSGSGGINVSVGSVTTADAQSFVTELPTLVKRNYSGIRTGLRSALGVT